MGFPKERFVDPDKIPIDVICPICKDVVEDPKQCKNGHVFCYVCIMQWLDRDESCPIDKEELCDDDLYNCLMAKQWINEMTVKCEHKGCDWTGQYKTVEHHDTKCEMMTIECSECGVTLIRKDLPVHNTEVCPSRIVACPLGCRNVLQFKNLDTHLMNECSNRTVLCGYCGEKSMVKDEHVNKCDKKPIECEFCRDKMVKSELSNHLTDCELRLIKCEDCSTLTAFTQYIDHLQCCVNRYMQCPDCDWAGKMYPVHAKTECRGSVVRCIVCGDEYRFNRFAEHAMGVTHMAAVVQSVYEQNNSSNDVICTENSVAYNRGITILDGKRYQSITLTSYSHNTDAVAMIQYPLLGCDKKMDFRFAINKRKNDNNRFIGVFFSNILDGGFPVHISGRLTVTFIFHKSAMLYKYVLVNNLLFDSIKGLDTGRPGEQKYAKNWGNQRVTSDSAIGYAYNNGSITIKCCIHFELDEQSNQNLKEYALKQNSQCMETCDEFSEGL